MALPNNTFPILFLIVGLVIAAVFVFVIVSVVRNVSRAKSHGIDPFTAQTDIAAKLLNSDLLSEGQTKVERLAEVNALLADGSITAAEHAEARAAILRA